MFVIIGASSFIGAYTATYFIEQGEKVIVTGRNNKFKNYYEKLGAEYVNLDLNIKEDLNRLPQKDVEAIILIAGALPASENADLKVNENVDCYVNTNVIGICHVLEYCRKNGIKRLLHTISFAEISRSLRLFPPIDENEPRSFDFVGDHAAYVISKCAAADISEYYNQQHGMRNAWFRLPPVYGVGPHGHLKLNGRIVKSGLQVFIDNACLGNDIEVYGYLARDTVYVKDVAEAFYKAVKSDATYGLYNISSGRATTLREQAEVCAELFAKDVKHQSKVIYRDDIINTGKSYLFSIEKANRDFGYKPRFSDFRELMKDYIFEQKRGVYSELFSDRDV